MALFGAFTKQTSKEIDVLRHDVGIFKNLINERQHPLDLVRELLSNAGAGEVGATRIEVSYTKDKQGHVFDVSDNGCGMDFSNDAENVGRLDRFLGLGLSSIVGEKSDEFSWKGLGSKLAYQSRRVMIETRADGHPLYEVRINEPWDTLAKNAVPRPRITEHPNSDCPTGTRIKVLGHPPHRRDEPFTADEIRNFLLHRTFVGYTRLRPNPPDVILSVLGRIERLDFGFPEFRSIDFPNWLSLDAGRKTLLVNMALERPPSMSVRLKGFLTWEPEPFGLREASLNTGLILSSRGIPYFEVPLEGLGFRRIAGSPGRAKVCLVADCDQVYSQMNLSRSGLVDSEATVELTDMLRQLAEHLQTSDEYAEFRRMKTKLRRAKQGAAIATDQASIRSDSQNWVVLDRDGAPPLVLMREPRNETEAAAILWKLESLGALPFEKFQTVGYPGASRNPDLFVNFQEDKGTEATQAALFEAGNTFCSYKHHEDMPSLQPKVICWDLGGRKTRLGTTDKKYKFTVDGGGPEVPVYVMKLMDGLSVLSTRELRARGVSI